MNPNRDCLSVANRMKKGKKMSAAKDACEGSGEQVAKVFEAARSKAVDIGN